MKGEEHEKLEKLLLGKSYRWVDKLMDIAYLTHGAKHRAVWGHDKWFPLLVYALSKDTKAMLASFLHLYADKHSKKLRRLMKWLP